MAKIPRITWPKAPSRVKKCESRDLAMFKSNSKPLSEPEYLALDRLFSDVDAFCFDPELRDEDSIDEPELRVQCKKALQKLGHAE